MSGISALTAALQVGRDSISEGVHLVSARNLHGQDHRLQIIQHTRDVIIEHLTAGRENLRDAVQIEFQKFQTLMLMDTLLFSISFIFIIEGDLPEDASLLMQYLYAITMGFAVIFAIISAILLYEIQSHVSKWMRVLLKDQLTRLRGIMLEGVHLDAFLLNEYGVPYPKEFLESEDDPDLDAVLAQREIDIIERCKASPDANFDDRRKDGQHILRSFHNRQNETEEEYIATVQHHLVQLRQILARAEPEQRFRNLLAGPLKPPRRVALVFFHMGSTMLLLAAVVFTLEYYRGEHGTRGPGIFFAVLAFVAVLTSWAVASINRMTGGNLLIGNRGAYTHDWFPETMAKKSTKSKRKGQSGAANLYGAAGQVIQFPDTTDQETPEV